MAKRKGAKNSKAAAKAKVTVAPKTAAESNTASKAATVAADAIELKAAAVPEASAAPKANAATDLFAASKAVAAPVAPASDSSAAFRILQVFMFAATFFIGLYHEPAACAAAVFLIGYLLYLFRRQGGLKLSLSLAAVSVAAVSLGYLLTVCWAVDRGMALLGFVKFLPVVLFLVLLLQLNASQQAKLLLLIPWSGAVMTLVSYTLQWFEVLTDFFTTLQRLAGFFQYANVFALYLLIGIIVLVFAGPVKAQSLLLLAVLVFGIFASGSRTVFILLLLTVIIILIVHPDRKIRKYLLLLLAAALVLSVAVLLLTDSYDTAARYLTISLSSKEFLARVLYYKDALPVILQHPLGLGYLGYYFTEPSFQTGAYTVAYVHNDWLQLLLDIGWLPALLLAAAVVRSFWVNKDWGKRLILLVIAAHCLLDFDLQYVVIWFALLLVLNYETDKKPAVLQSRALLYGLSGVLCAACVYLGSAGLAYYAGNYKLAARLYPAYTSAQLVLLQEADSAEEMAELADSIIARNAHVALAYSAKAEVAYSQGDFNSLIYYKELTLQTAPYAQDEYEDYFAKLWSGVELYTKAGDQQSADYCRMKLQEIPQRLQAVKDKTDPLAYQLAKKPQLELPEEYEAMLEQLDEYYWVNSIGGSAAPQ